MRVVPFWWTSGSQTPYPPTPPPFLRLCYSCYPSWFNSVCKITRVRIKAVFAEKEKGLWLSLSSPASTGVSEYMNILLSHLKHSDAVPRWKNNAQPASALSNFYSLITCCKKAHCKYTQMREMSNLQTICLSYKHKKHTHTHTQKLTKLSQVCLSAPCV